MSKKRDGHPEARQARATRGILIDSNLLLVLVVGTYEPLYVSRHKRTRQYTSEDFYRIRELVRSCSVRLTTPHILTEVSNHLGQSRDPVKAECFRAFSRVIPLFEEVHVAARQILLRPHFTEMA